MSDTVVQSVYHISRSLIRATTSHLPYNTEFVCHIARAISSFLMARATQYLVINLQAGSLTKQDSVFQSYI